MEDKRRFNRWGLEEKAVIDLEGAKEEVKVLDVSIGGMRIVTNTPLDKEKIVTGEFKILPNVGPFFVKGKVIWSNPRGDTFESGIVFDKVSTIPLS